MTPTPPTSELEILIVDDHPIVRRGLRNLLEGSGFRVCGEAADGDDAIRAAAELQPDMVIMDLAMPGVGGIEATRQIIKQSPHVAVLVVSMSEEDASVFAALRAGARGYVLKGSDPSDLLRAVESISRGDAVFGPGLADRVLAYFSQQIPPRNVAFPELSEREREVLGLLAQGLHNPEISRRLGIRPKTVRNHVSNVLTKLAATDRTEAILRARAAGLT